MNEKQNEKNEVQKEVWFSFVVFLLICAVRCAWEIEGLFQSGEAGGGGVEGVWRCCAFSRSFFFSFWNCVRSIAAALPSAPISDPPVVDALCLARHLRRLVAGFSARPSDLETLPNERVLFTHRNGDERERERENLYARVSDIYTPLCVLDAWRVQQLQFHALCVKNDVLVRRTAGWHGSRCKVCALFSFWNALRVHSPVFVLFTDRYTDSSHSQSSATMAARCVAPNARAQCLVKVQWVDTRAWTLVRSAQRRSSVLKDRFYFGGLCCCCCCCCCCFCCCCCCCYCCCFLSLARNIFYVWLDWNRCAGSNSNFQVLNEFANSTPAWRFLYSSALQWLMQRMFSQMGLGHWVRVWWFVYTLSALDALFYYY